jgi:hypothetical protein
MCDIDHPYTCDASTLCYSIQAECTSYCVAYGEQAQCAINQGTLPDVSGGFIAGWTYAASVGIVIGIILLSLTCVFFIAIVTMQRRRRMLMSGGVVYGQEQPTILAVGIVMRAPQASTYQQSAYQQSAYQQSGVVMGSPAQYQQEQSEKV